jgi:hypothetical protein
MKTQAQGVPASLDLGSALLAAHAILADSYHHCCCNNTIPDAVRLIVYRAQQYIGDQYALYLRGAL